MTISVNRAGWSAPIWWLRWRSRRPRAGSTGSKTSWSRATSGETTEKNGSIAFLSANLADELLRIDLCNLGISKIGADKTEANSDRQRGRRSSKGKGQESGQGSQGKSRKSQGKRPEPEVAIASRKGFNASAAGCEVASRTKFTACVLSRVFDSDAGGPSNRPSLAVVSNACSSPAAHRESNLAAQPHLRGSPCERQSACLTGAGPRCAIERGAVSYNGASENHASPAYRPHPIG